jgi:hypothetical protein
MPTTDSNLAGNFISNTYQKILQTDSQFGKVGDEPFNLNELDSGGSKNAVLNGSGKAMPGLVIDHTSTTNGGLFLQAINGSSVEYQGIQLGNPSSTNTSAWGMNFGKTSAFQHRMFLSNMGNLWVGYMNDASNITAGVNSYSLYVSDGIQIGVNNTNGNGRINLVGNSPLENGAGFFINGESPFKVVRYFYDQGSGFKSFRTRYLKFPSTPSSQPGLNISTDPASNEWISDNEWTALVVGFARSQQSGDTPIKNAGCLAFTDGGYWKVGFSFANIAGGGPDQDWLIDVLFIKKGFFSNLRPSGRPSSAGSISDGSRGGSWS